MGLMQRSNRSFLHRDTPFNPFAGRAKQAEEFPCGLFAEMAGKQAILPPKAVALGQWERQMTGRPGPFPEFGLDLGGQSGHTGKNWD